MWVFISLHDNTSASSVSQAKCPLACCRREYKHESQAIRLHLCIFMKIKRMAASFAMWLYFLSTIYRKFWTSSISLHAKGTETLSSRLVDRHVLLLINNSLADLLWSRQRKLLPFLAFMPICSYKMTYIACVFGIFIKNFYQPSIFFQQIRKQGCTSHKMC